MPPQVTCRSDLFSLGITMFYCATGMFPFCKATADDITICYHLTKDPTPAAPLKLNEDGAPPLLAQGLAMVVAKALEKSVPVVASSSSSAAAMPMAVTRGYLNAGAMNADLHKIQRYPTPL